MPAVLAYGEFRSFEWWDMFWACVPRCIAIMVPALFLYVVCSALVEVRATRWLAIPLWCVVCVFMPPLGVLGAFGPAHVALRVAAPIWPLLFVVLVAKTIVYRRRR